MGRARLAVAAGAALAAAAAAAALASPLFYDTVVDEPPPASLPGALGEVRAGLTLAEFSSMPDGERAPLVERMPEATREMVMDAAAGAPADAPGDAMPGRHKFRSPT